MNKIAHIGLTVSNLEVSLKFYCDILGLKLVSRTTMQGPSTDRLFNADDIIVELAYLECSGKLAQIPLELICFKNKNVEKTNSSLLRTSISEVCFLVDDIESLYLELKKQGVCFLSEVEEFELDGIKSKAVYFKDPDGIILELIEYF